MKALEKIIGIFRRFPGVGPKQAERFAMYVVKASPGEVESMVEALREVKALVKYCPDCYNYAEGGLCPICADQNRDRSLICVVERPQDLAAIEKAKSFSGVYHVLHGAVSPVAGVSPDQIRMKELLDRVRASDGAVKEVIIATNPDADGEATAMYLTRLLKPYVEGITRIAYGVPLGGDIDYMDEVTLGYALKGRIKI
ncbi:MAG TPA: recombination protein RecR [Elusimicrobia bacterium]|jgi:recombination protein RecR|nr:MAG: recombination protein RecR [Elusimicrobia bacterium GWA2_64_40]OGR63831.1 MAG: recombination protein RecR [Elusimicrobia bacterium GWB2_63_16]HAN04895.1 recombination protein RecR [Elusimicrobiota bacterium]HAU89518.1 recombination protein RecR [Elusimicrobiota bacterium]